MLRNHDKIDGMFQKDLTKMVDHCLQLKYPSLLYVWTDFSTFTISCIYSSKLLHAGLSLQLYSKLCYRSLLLNYFSRDKALPRNSHCRAISCGYFHYTTQDGWTALERASIKGHQKVVELLLGAGANPDLQNKVRIGHMHANLGNCKVIRHSSFL